MLKLFRWLLKAFIVASALLLLLFSVFFLSVSMGIFGPLPTKASITNIHNEEASLVFSSDGSLIGKYFAENRTNISWEEVPSHLVNALVATEDKRFYLHKGVDSRSYVRVFFKSILMGSRSSGGGSTLTQQLVKNLYGRNDHSILSMPVNKLKEALIASRMESVFSKEEILLLYLNSVPFGEEVYGIEAAAKRYFDKHASQLNLQESAVLVGILKANTTYNPRLHAENATARRNQILRLMANEGFISSAEADSLQSLPLDLKYANYLKESPAGYFVYQVKKRLRTIIEQQGLNGGKTYDIEKDGLKIYTSLDLDLQLMASHAAEMQLKKMQILLDKELTRRKVRKRWESNIDNYDEKQLAIRKKREVFDWDENLSENMSLSDSLWHYYRMLHAAVLVAEPSSGRVLGWVGGNHYRYLPYDMIYAERQIASAIKPLIYAAALESGYEACTYLNNETKTYEDFDDWTPENYDGRSTDSLVALWYALANSMNLPTVDLFFKTGYPQVADVLRRFELDVPRSVTPAISLGAIDVSLYEIVKAYGAIANDGHMLEKLVMIDKITDAQGKLLYESKAPYSEEVLQVDVCKQLTAMLERTVDQGTAVRIRNTYGLKADLAGKTGTAQNYSNAWFMSYTPNLVIGTWVGATSPELHFAGGLGSGSVLALPISGALLSGIEKNASMRKKYLVDFPRDEQIEEMLNCSPYFERGLPGFINRLTNTEEGKNKVKVDSLETDSDKPKKKGKFRKFIDRIFKGQRDK